MQKKGESDKQKSGTIPICEGVWDITASPHLNTPHIIPLKGDVWPGNGCALVRALCLKMLMDGEEAQEEKEEKECRWWGDDNDETSACHTTTSQTAV